MGEEAVVPAGALELATDQALGRFELGEVEGEAPQQGEVLGAMVLAVAGPVLVQGHIEHPRQAVLDLPVGADEGAEAGRIERPAEQVIAGLDGGLAVALATGGDLADGASPGQ